jgi:hypothetical protein
MKNILFICSLVLFSVCAIAQEKPASRGITMAEYDKSKTFTVKDLDNDTYVKFENAYILDRYEAKKPYFITGDDGLKKRVDLYKLIAKEGMLELGTVAFYTNENGKQYRATLPNFMADPKVWTKYFEDIHAIDKEEKNFVLKLSYVLSKEFSFQLYKFENQGKDISAESATYGNDICFTGSMEVSMANGKKKLIQDIRPGDKVITVDPATGQAAPISVKELAVHDEKNYAVTEVIMIRAVQTDRNRAHYVELRSAMLNATPNHPVLTNSGRKELGQIKEGDEILSLNSATNKYEPFIVWNIRNKTEGPQKVYNIVAESGETVVINGVMVLQK